MNIDPNTVLGQFKQYADIEINANRKSSVVRVQTPLGNGRSIHIARATDDSVGALMRSAESKRANAYARDIFYRHVAKLFGGSDRIPPAINDVLTNFGGSNERPLTARRIRAVMKAIENFIEPPVNEERPVQAPQAPVVAQAGDGQPQQQTSVCRLKAFADAKTAGNDAYNKELAEYEKSSKNKDEANNSTGGLFGTLFSLVGLKKDTTKPPVVKVFKPALVGSGITFGDMPAKEDIDANACKEIRRRFVASVEKTLRENGIPEKVSSEYVRNLQAAILAPDVADKPLEVNDSLVRDAIEFASRGETYRNDTVSTSVGNRGTVKVDTAKFLSSVLLKNLIGAKLGDRDLFSFSGVSMTKGADGFMNLTIRDLTMKDSASDWKLQSVKSLLLKEKIDHITIPLKPAYNPATGTLSLTIGKILSDKENIGGMVSSTLKILDLVSDSDQAAVKDAGLSAQEKSEGYFGRFELNLRRMGSEKLTAYNLNESFGANVSDMKFSENGVIIRFGDNVQAQNPQAAPLAGSRIPANEGIGGGDASLTIVPEAYKGIVENALRGKFGFTSINMSTRPGGIGFPGTVDVSLEGVDLSRFAANGGIAVKLASKLGFLKPGNVRISVRPAVDPISKRIRLDIVSLNYGGAVKSFFAKKFLTKVLNGILANKVKGVGVAVGPIDSIASISMDPKQALEKVAQKIPGGIPDIKTLRADANGLSIGIDF